MQRLGDLCLFFFLHLMLALPGEAECFPLWWVQSEQPSSRWQLTVNTSITSVHELEFHILSIQDLKIACTLCRKPTPASRNINKRASVLIFLSQTHQSDAQVKEHPLGEERRQVCRSGSSRARNISHSAEIDWPWRSMWTLSMSNEAPPSSSSAPPEAI